MSLLAFYTTKFPRPSLEPYLSLPVKNSKNQRQHTASFAEFCQPSVVCCWRSLGPSQDVEQFYSLSKLLSAFRLHFSNSSPLPYVLVVWCTTNSLPDIDFNRHFPCKAGEERQKDRNSAALPAACPQGSTRAGTWPLSCLFAAILCFWCKMMGTHGKRMHRNAWLLKAKGVNPFISLIWFSEKETT